MRTLLLLVCGCALVAAEDTKKPSPAPKAAGAQTMIGCVDEGPNSSYILRKGGEMEKIASLRSNADSDSMFARFVGQTVSVRGKLSGSGADAVMHVARISKVADSCTTP